jgi:hypothetical protein
VHTRIEKSAKIGAFYANCVQLSSGFFGMNVGTFFVAGAGASIWLLATWFTLTFGCDGIAARGAEVRFAVHNCCISGHFFIWHSCI